LDIGLGLAQLGDFADPTITRTMAAAAETSGYSSLWAIDRLLVPLHPGAPYPGKVDGHVPVEQHTVLDPLVTLTVAAGVTERIRLGTDVLVAPWYPPALLARSLASVDHVSRGRLVVGLGLGWSPDEYRAVGVPQEHLGTRLEEILELMSTAWRDDVVEMETSRETIVPSTIALKPFTRPRPPILLAAFTPAGLERIARRADGWTPAGVPLGVVGAMWSGVLDLAERYGRNRDAMRLVVRANVTLTTEALGDDRPDFVGSFGQVRDDVERARDAGADELIVDLQGTTRSVDELLEVSAGLTAGVLASH
jgi:probable F420-dependent oxidoreductase